MSFSESAGTTIVPTLARIVLAGVFITAGFQKVFTNVPYSADDVETLRGMDVELETTASTAMTWDQSGIDILPAAYVQDGGTGDDTQDDTSQDPPPDTGGDDQDTGDDATEPPGDDEVVGQEQPEELTPGNVIPVEGEAVGKGAYRVAIMVDQHGWPQPKLMAWIASYTELVGGVLILVGLFSRLWGAGLAITMGVAFYFTSWSGLSGASFNLYTVMDENMMLFQSMFLQLALCVLALTVLFAGPGPISIDRLLFGKTAAEGADEV